MNNNNVMINVSLLINLIVIINNILLWRIKGVYIRN